MSVRIIVPTDWQYDVGQFMAKHGVKFAVTPTIPDLHSMVLARRLIQEETQELLTALDQISDPIYGEYRDIPPLAKELADVIYVVLYAASVFGIEMQSVFSAVHGANMTKDGEQRTDGKITKGAAYIDPMASIRALMEV